VRKPAPWSELSWEAAADAAIAEEAAQLAANPVLAKEKRRARQVCNCNTVDVGTIEDAIREDRLASVAEVTARTNAGSGCGSCGGKIVDILTRLNSPADNRPAAASA
jgi:nitrogenase molybdenum-cofactor synthesis protein NifE